MQQDNSFINLIYEITKIESNNNNMNNNSSINNNNINNNNINIKLNITLGKSININKIISSNLLKVQLGLNELILYYLNILINSYPLLLTYFLILWF